MKCFRPRSESLTGQLGGDYSIKAELLSMNSKPYIVAIVDLS